MATINSTVPGLMWRLRDDKHIYELSFQVHVTNDSDKDMQLPKTVEGNVTIGGIALPAALEINEYPAGPDGKPQRVVEPEESAYFQCVQDISGADALLKLVREHEGEQLPVKFALKGFVIEPAQSYKIVIVA